MLLTLEKIYSLEIIHSGPQNLGFGYLRYKYNSDSWVTIFNIVFIRNIDLKV